MAQHSVILDTDLQPAQLTIVTGDTVVWTNASPQVQGLSSDDGGLTFTTGPIQIGSTSLPIVFVAASDGVPYSSTAGAHGTIVVGTGFQQSIRSFFSAVDRDAMLDAAHTFGIITFDLWSPDDCRANWDAIRDAIAGGRMPPPDDPAGPWPQAKIDRFVNAFQAWKDGGFRP